MIRFTDAITQEVFVVKASYILGISYALNENIDVVVWLTTGEKKNITMLTEYIAHLNSIIKCLNEKEGEAR